MQHGGRQGENRHRGSGKTDPGSVIDALIGREIRGGWVLSETRQKGAHRQGVPGQGHWRKDDGQHTDRAFPRRPDARIGGTAKE